MIRNEIAQSPFLPGWVWLIPLALMILLYEVLQPLASPGERIAWYSIGIVIMAAVVTRACRIDEQGDLFEPLHLVFALFLIFYPLRALFAVWLDDSWFDPSKAAIWVALSASAAGFVCFAIGYKMAPRGLCRRPGVWLDRMWSIERANTVALAFLVVGLAGFVAMRFLGGSLLYFILVDPDIKAPQDIKPWFFYLFWICVFIQVGALIQLGIWFSTGRRTLWTALYCALALLSTFLLARYITVLFLILLALSSHYKKRKITVPQVTALFCLAIVYLGVAGLYREWVSPGYNLEQTGELFELAGQQKELVVRYVINNLEQLSNLTEVMSMTPSELPYQFGATFTPIFLKPIPRVLMPSKPLGASALFSQTRSPDTYDAGLVTGLGAWGEWYLNFSWWGLVVGMGMTGALTAAGYSAMRATTQFGRVMLYSSLVVVLFTWLRNDFNSAITYGLYYFIPAVAALAYITGIGSQSPRATHS